MFTLSTGTTSRAGTSYLATGAISGTGTSCPSDRCNQWSRNCLPFRKVPLVEQELLTLQQVPLVEQELLILPENMSSHPVFRGGCVVQSSIFHVVFFYHCCFLFFVFSFWPGYLSFFVLTDIYLRFGILKHFFEQFYKHQSINQSINQ